MLNLSNKVDHSGGYVLGSDDKKTKLLRSGMYALLVLNDIHYLL